MRIDTLGGGDFFRWDLKTPSIKVVNTSLKQKRFQIFSLWGQNVFLHPVARGWENFKFLGDLIYFLGGGRLGHLLQ